MSADQGWKPPVIYDIYTDSYRAVTQQDVDFLLEVQRLYIGLRRSIRDMAKANTAAENAAESAPKVPFITGDWSVEYPEIKMPRLPLVMERQEWSPQAWREILP